VAGILLLAAATGAAALAQTPSDDRAAADAMARRVGDRIRALQREAD
jgi:hypothetical protein